jgi:hypothetical protein
MSDDFREDVAGSGTISNDLEIQSLFYTSGLNNVSQLLCKFALQKKKRSVKRN